MSASKLKITPPPKLEGKNLSIDKLQTWFSGLKNCFKHDKDHKQFLKGEAFETWSALKTDSTRGITLRQIRRMRRCEVVAQPLRSNPLLSTIRLEVIQNSPFFRDRRSGCRYHRGSR